MAKTGCKRGKGRNKVHGYSRCEAGSAGRRNTRAERRAKKCHRGAKKQGVSAHKRCYKKA